MEKFNGKYGNAFMMKGSPAKDMKSGEEGMAKKRIPDAMTNKTGKDMKFEGGRMNGVCYTHDRKSCQ
ncbi:hypothetical protein EBZ39_02015 [bacterium]|nr:hypothetical protein [bacterium]